MTLRDYKEQLEGKTKDELIMSLINVPITPFEKNVLYTYFYPAPLRHMELLEVMKNGKRTIERNDTDILRLLRAYRGRQYQNFIRHLLHSYIEAGDKTYIVNEKVPGAECCICGKKIYGHEFWSQFSNDDPEREHLAYGNEETGLMLCIDCMIQLKYLNDLLVELEGPTYLNWKSCH